MKFITEPYVHVLATPQFHPDERFPIPADGTDAEKLCSYAAKRCYRSIGADGRPNTENQAQVIKQRHGSVLQHAHFSLAIEGVSRGCSLELNRHGLDISQLSMRYADANDCAFVLDPWYAEQWAKWVVCYNETVGDILFKDGVPADVQDLLDMFVDSNNLALQFYDNSVERLMRLAPDGTAVERRKWARGKAKQLLPHALETQGVWSGNIRMWRWIVESRTELAAEAEIRRLANAVFKAIEPHCPTHWADFLLDPLGDEFGGPVLFPQYRKV